VLRVARVAHRDDEVVLDVLVGEHRGARRDPSHQRDDDALGAVGVGQRHGPGLGRVLGQEASALEVRQLRVNARGGREPHGLADFADGGRITAPVDGGGDEVHDPALPGGERSGLGCLGRVAGVHGVHGVHVGASF
jgi:hypothetical protein